MTFNITDDTKINLRGNVGELSQGLFVVVSAVQDGSSGVKDALEINVTRGRPPILGPVETFPDEDEGDIDNRRY